MSISYHIEDSLGRLLSPRATRTWVCTCKENFFVINKDDYFNILDRKVVTGIMLGQCSICRQTWWLKYDSSDSPEKDFLSDLIIFEKDGLWQIATQDKCPFCDSLIDRYHISDVLICHSCRATSLSKEELEIHFVLAQNQSRF